VSYKLLNQIFILFTLRESPPEADKPMIRHLLCCSSRRSEAQADQGLAVAYGGLSRFIKRGFALDAARSETKIPLSGESGASSTFAQLGFQYKIPYRSLLERSGNPA